MEFEKQNIEWKESWRDEYLAWICGYANAQGGILYIGKNDNGKIVGINDAKKLLENLPNTISNVLGITVDVNLLSENGLNYIEIIVESYTNPISFKGEYHYRTGSTKQILKGATLNKFLLERNGQKWDSVTLPSIKVIDLETSSFDYFRKNAIPSRISQISEDNNDILENLYLWDNSLLKRAAVLLFHQTPEKYITGAYIKIGFFRSDEDLAFQDEIKGSLFTQIEKTIDLLETKYFQAAISYQKLKRIETYPYPIKALREALLNAITHKDYSTGNPIQISVYENKLQIWNDGQIPIEWTLEKFLGKHPSKAPNPAIANTFFRVGLIEAWGRGIPLIMSEFAKNGFPKPVFNFDFEGLTVIFDTKEITIEKETREYNTNSKMFQFSQEALDRLYKAFETLLTPKEYTLTEKQISDFILLAKQLELKSLKIVTNLYEKLRPIKRQEIMNGIALSNQTKNIKRYLEPLLNQQIVRIIIKDKPNSVLQTYEITNKGKKFAYFLNEALQYNNDKLTT